MTIELDSTLAQAEVLFRSYAQLIADMDRRRAEEPAEPTGLRRRTTSGQVTNPSSTAADADAQAKRFVISEELRELLKAS